MKAKTVTVIHFVHTLYGGVANVAAGLINYQNDCGIKTVLAYCNYDSAIESQLHYKCERIHVKMAKYPGSNMLFGMKVLKIYKDYMKLHSTELVIVHVHNIQTLGCFANWKNIPIICTLHGFNCPQKSVRKYFSDFLYKETLLKLIKYEKKITAVSNAIVDAEECRKIKGKNNITVIHNFSDVNLYDKKEHLTFNVGYVGDLSYEKGFDTLWKAYMLLPDYYKEKICLYISGKEADFKGDWIKKEIQKNTALKNVVYEGYVPNAKKDFISKLDILIITSRNEGLGLVQIEAMGYGIPVLGRNTGGICEVLKNGYNGFVIADEIELSCKIKELYDDKKLYSRLSDNALLTYKQNFTAKIIMKKYREVYKDLLKKF